LEDGVGESGTGCDLIRIGVGGKWVPTGYVERFDRNGVEDFVSISPCEIRPQESAADLLGTCCVPCLDLALDSGIKRRVGYEHMTHLVNSEVPQCLMAMEQSWKLVMAFQIHLASSFYKEWEGRTGADSDVMARLGSVT
jgi:hypothetical protein